LWCRCGVVVLLSCRCHVVVMSLSCRCIVASGGWRLATVCHRKYVNEAYKSCTRVLLYVLS